MNRFEKVSEGQYLKDILNDMKVDYEIMSTAIQEYANIKVPVRAHVGDAGYDFFSPVSFTLHPGETIKLATGIRVILDEDKFLAIVPRSGLGFKYRLQLDNTLGVVDASYSLSDNEGHIFIKMTNDGRQGRDVVIKEGDAIAQGIIMKYYTVDDDETSGVRNGGFGSSDKERQNAKEKG